MITFKKVRGKTELNINTEEIDIVLNDVGECSKVENQVFVTSADSDFIINLESEKQTNILYKLIKKIFGV